MALTLSVAAGLAETLTGLVAGGVSLGSVTFQDMEVPEKITSGGTQQLTVHRLLGGMRVIDAMGPDDRSLDWSGIFRGLSAASRGRQLDAMRTAGKPVQLRWLGEVRTVIVQSCELDWTKGGNRIPYRISCTVVPRPATPAKPGLLQQLGSDITSALGIDGILPDISGALQQVQAAMPVAAVLTGGSSTFLALSGAVGTASGIASAGAALGNGALDSLSSAASAAGQTIPSVDAGSMASSIQSALTAATSASTYGAIGDLVSRVSGNLSRVSP